MRHLTTSLSSSRHLYTLLFYGFVFPLSRLEVNSKEAEGASQIYRDLGSTLVSPCWWFAEGPEFVPAIAEYGGSELGYRLSTLTAPDHARLFESSPDDPLASAFNHTTADVIPFSSEFSVTHPIFVLVEVVDLLGQGLPGLGRGLSSTPEVA